MKEWFKKFWRQLKCRHKNQTPGFHCYTCNDCGKIIWD